MPLLSLLDNVTSARTRRSMCMAEPYSWHRIENKSNHMHLLPIVVVVVVISITTANKRYFREEIWQRRKMLGERRHNTKTCSCFSFFSCNVFNGQSRSFFLIQLIQLCIRMRCECLQYYAIYFAYSWNLCQLHLLLIEKSRGKKNTQQQTASRNSQMNERKRIKIKIRRTDEPISFAYGTHKRTRTDSHTHND